MCVYVRFNSSDFNADEMKGVDRHAGLETMHVTPVSKGSFLHLLTHIWELLPHMKRRKRTVYKEQNSCMDVSMCACGMWFVCVCVCTCV